MPLVSRRRLRIGIGGLMLAVLVFALWLGDRVNRAREQKIAVAAVKEDGGYVHYSDEFAMRPVDVPRGDAMWKPSWGMLRPGQGPSAPAWLRRRLGDEFFREVAHVSLFVDIQKGSATAPNNLPRPVDDVLRAIRTQSGIRTLQVGGDTVTDAGLESIARLADLRELNLSWATKITDAGVAHLAGLPRLRMVEINCSGLTDEAIRHLADLPRLEDLSVQGKKFTDQSLIALSKTKHLKSVWLLGDLSGVTDRGLEQLGALKDLRKVYLQGANISGAAKARLMKAIPGLEIND